MRSKQTALTWLGRQPLLAFGRTGAALLCGTLLLSTPAWCASTAQEAASGTPATSGSALPEKAREAGRVIGQEASKIGTAVAKGAREAASATSTVAREAWQGTRDGAIRVGSAASAAAREFKQKLSTPASGASR